MSETLTFLLWLLFPLSLGAVLGAAFYYWQFHDCDPRHIEEKIEYRRKAIHYAWSLAFFIFVALVILWIRSSFPAGV
jgi:hypothetical protein